MERGKALPGGVMSERDDAMSYAEKWVQIKAEFEQDNKDIAEELEAAKAKLKKQKDKTKPNQDKIDDLEDMIANTVTIKKKKTGLTQLLPVYDKVLDKMDALMAAKHDPADAKVWKPLYQSLAKLRPAMTKANAAAQKNFGDWEDYAVKSWANYAKTGGSDVQKIEKRLKPKNTAARDLLNELSKMQREMAQRMAAISSYLGDSKDNW
jgi:septal ring factor EnvC (AmiA/AmiB activator)